MIMKNKMKMIWVALITSITLLFQNCMSRHDSSSQSLSGSASTAVNNERITAGAMSVLQNKCSNCHSPTSTVVTPITDILDIDGLTKEGWVVPGAPQNSLLYTSIIDGTMPQNGSLSDSEMNLVRDWIIVLGGGDPNANPNGTGSGSGGTTPPPAPQTGTVLYNTYCSGCHGVGAASSKRGRTASQITNAINTVPNMMNLSNALNATQIQAIATYLGSI